MGKYQAWLWRITLVVLGWLGISVFFSMVIIASDLGRHKKFLPVLYGHALHFGIWALALPLLVRCVKRFPLPRSNWPRNVLALLSITLVLSQAMTLAYMAALYFSWFPYRKAFPTFAIFLELELVRNLNVNVLICLVLIVTLQGWRVWQDFQAERMRAAELERQLAESQLKALRMQIHPHFLFNTLHTITSLIGTDSATARRMVIGLGDFLRRTLNDGAAPLRSLAEEIEFTDLYLGIEKLRLGDRLILDYDIESDATTAEVPHLLLQPLFENAVKHGAARLTGPCEINFRTRRENGRLNLSLENDGPLQPEPSGPVQFRVGLENTLARLQLHYGDDFTFQYTDRPEGGVRIDLSLPYRKADCNHEPV